MDSENLLEIGFYVDFEGESDYYQVQTQIYLWSRISSDEKITFLVSIRYCVVFDEALYHCMYSKMNVRKMRFFFMLAKLIIVLGL